MEHEKILRREDGSRVKIEVWVTSCFDSDIEYESEVYTYEKDREEWVGTWSPGYSYRGLSMEERATHRYNSQFPTITPEELQEAKLELWEKMKP